ncbi:DUF262 domain-containing protein [Sphingobacterium siyangense]|uniref:GmrSD restriction endonuclease domain-containing protein n=1 Tax=Sphingobacterium siyangense TaxID=459529 RepID=UPI002010C56F|nr:DUF262 domain-containing protein [Sphingobacterium siyangense]UQA76708.1 DUF262 domain-containing protein [Sphingobacterium siyangense]
MNNDNQLSFVNIIAKFKIQIPILQRDYVQGRKNDTVNEIRVNFVEDLIGHISTHTQKILPLDFVYGYADEEFGKYDREVAKKNLNALLATIAKYSSPEEFQISYTIKDHGDLKKNLFIPLDGQQRLTTLFLLHLYVALKFRPEQISLLEGKLTYKTRKSSDAFLSKLVENAKSLSQELAIDDAIKDASWFLISWLKDPTVEGMLVMLREIEDRFASLENKNESIQLAYDNLFVSPKIKFDFLDLNEQGITDDIYLKMNSTGKSLSDYDNFKSWFVGKVEALLEKNKCLKEQSCFTDWKDKLDQDWYNIFWEHDQRRSDQLMYSFIRSVLSYAIVFSDEEEKDKKLKFDKLNSDTFLSLKFFEENELITEENISFLFNLLEELANESESLLDISELWNSTFTSEGEFRKVVIDIHAIESLLHRTFIYAAFLLMVRRSSFNRLEFKKWVRIFRNIVYNTRIDDFPRFIHSIKATHDFLSGDQRLYTDNEKWVDFFSEKQVREEFHKFQLENNDNETIEAFEKAEDHFYLYGQIDFLINWSRNENGEFELNTFQRFRERFEKLFSKEHLESKILQQVLLVFGDTWMPDKGSYRYSFCKSSFNSARERDENWRQVFSDKDSGILNILNSSECETEDLKGIISTHIKNVNDWRRYILEDGSLIDQCGQRLINWLGGGNFVRLLDKTKLSGYHTELRTWVLFKKLKERFGDHLVEYSYANSGERDCRIYFVTSGFFLRFDRHSSLFCFEILDEENNQYNIVVEPEIENVYLDCIREFNLYTKVNLPVEE